MVLADARPAQLAVGNAVPVKGTFGGGEAVHGIGTGQACLFRILLQGVRPQLLRNLGKGHVAGIGEGLFQGLFPVDAGAGDGLLPHLDAAGAVPGPRLRIRQVFQRRRQGHGFEHGPRHKGRGKKTVQIGPFIAVILLQIRRNIHGIIAGRRNHAQNFTGFVVVHRHRPGVAVQGLVGFIVIAGVDGQVEIAALLRAEGSVHQIVARQLVRKGVQHPGADLAVQVPHGVEGGLADLRAVVIGAAAVLH